ncbi:S66 peptidase family protein [Polaribacter pacificus]
MNLKAQTYLVRLFFLSLISFASAQEMPNSLRVKSNQLVKAPYLKKGDTIAIVAPAGILMNREASIEKAKRLVESWGLHVVLGEHLYVQGSHFAGSDEERAADFQKALDNKNIKAIWSARGGYGSVRILDLLDFSTFKKHPKWIVGYSDITAIHSHVHNLGFETLHAMMATSLEEDPKETKKTIASFKSALFGESLSYQVSPNDLNRKGSAEGQLVGGNLTMLLTMLGSKSEIDTRGKILFIEEIGEYKYHIDRMLQSLKRAGYFENCKGLIIGDMTKIKKNTTPWGESIESLILEVVAEYDFPVLFDFPAGHEADNQAIILGRTIEMDVTEQHATVLFMQN